MTVNLTRARGAAARRLILKHLPSFYKLGKRARGLVPSAWPWRRLRGSSRSLGRFFARALRFLMRHWRAAIVLSLIAILCFTVYNDLARPVVMVEEFEAPSMLSEEIISSRGITQRFYDHLAAIRNSATTSFKEQGQFALAAEAEAIKVNYSGLEAT